MAGIGNNGVKRGPGKERRVRAAFIRMYDAEPDKLDELAAAAHREAVGGNMQALCAIRDTIDGRPVQQVRHTGADDGPIETTQVSETEAARRIAHVLMSVPATADDAEPVKH